MHKQILLYFLVKTAKTCCSSRNSASKSISMKVLDYPEYHASVLCHTISMLRADKVNVTENNVNAMTNSVLLHCAIYHCIIASAKCFVFCNNQ